jgi:macrolide transport system ATP-binding/permease protein
LSVGAALLELRGVERRYPSGETEVAVLKGVDIVIRAGEMVAIVGPSGSGKSTLMNILGCLDRPSAGSYAVRGEETGALDDDALARLRREHFGFIFQSYHLIAHLPATANVEVPAIYSGADRASRHARAAELLTRLGLGERLHHRPGQLSGGQQQRVSIARAWMNGGEVILADEPTGALDSRSGEEVLAILHELHARGHTVILVTHDMQVAAHAQRIIEISDGEIVADRAHRAVARAAGAGEADAPPAPRTRPALLGRRSAAWWNSFFEALRMAWISMVTHRMRTALTMLGIVIGISSVVSIVALGAGARAAILRDIGKLGTSTVVIYPGVSFGDDRADQMRSLRAADVELLGRQYFADSVSPEVGTMSLLRYRDRKGNASIRGVGADYLRVRGLHLERGIAFRPGNIEHMSQVVVIDHHAAEELFGHEDPLGKIIMVGDMPATVIGVVAKPTGLFSSLAGKDLAAWVPYTTAASRLLGHDWFDSITVRVRQGIPSATASKQAGRLLKQHHHRKDFHIQDHGDIAKTMNRITGYIELLLALIAAISLVVGGIGVMNIMLVSVSERTREIGIRMAVGARQGDIRRQFLIEAVMVCVAGGLVGIALAWLFGLLFRLLVSKFHMVFSFDAILIAFLFSSAIGLLFGFLPARNAARLDPIVALARE